MTLLHLIILIYCSFKLVLVGGTDMEVGNTIDLFRNYGLLMRIFPSDTQHQDFMSNEFSTNIFDKLLTKRVLTTTNQFKEETWKMKVCENILHVLQEMLTDYKIEYIDNVRNSFSTFWPFKVLAEFIGLHHIFLTSNNYSFILVQYKRCVSRFNVTQVAKIGPVLEAKFVEASEQIVIDDYRSVLNLTTQFGTHYVKSFSAGVAVYQVIAFPNKHYKCFSKVAPEFTLEDLHKCANGSHVHVGHIKTLSNWKILENRLNLRYKNKKSETPIIYTDSVKKKFINLNETEILTVIGFSLHSISDMITDRQKSRFVSEVIDNQMKLRELSL